jgi:hypothetical protein
MKKKLLAGLAVLGFVALGIGGTAGATLIVQGTVDYAGAIRNLIYDDDLKITWLDYSNGPDTWDNQMAWADTLSLTVNGVTYDDWRLPSAGAPPGLGYNQTSSEMGHLYYDEMHLVGGVYSSADTLNSGVFDNSVSAWYWSGTEYADSPAIVSSFSTAEGWQTGNWKGDVTIYALAVRPGQVQETAPVPEPDTILLFGVGIAGFVGTTLRRKKGIHLGD